MTNQPLYIAFLWHMHQPYYRDTVTGRCSMPWVRLHATKDYLDMLKRLEQFPSLHQTFNFVPSLLDQLEEYLAPANRSDDFLELSRRPAAELSVQEQRFTLQWFFLANIDRMIKPHPRYYDLFAKRGLQVAHEDWSGIQRRFTTQDYLDLQVWFNLAWIDPWLRHQDAGLSRLETKGSHFTEEEKRYVLEQHIHLTAQVIPAYREAARRGQIELTISPYYHPIMPLLCDTRSAHVALPQLPLPPPIFRHPEDAAWQLREALLRHERAFGSPAAGVWPPEGSVSEEATRLMMEAGVRWLATDEGILWRTLKTSRSAQMLYRPHVLRRKFGQMAILFRDRELSDLLGFVYSQWDPKIAIEDFIRRLAEIRQLFESSEQPGIVSVILDGENAWESYANDGHEFLTGLYGALANDDRFRCVTVTEFLQQYPLETTESLPNLFAGSWIDSNFATWIGHPEKNAAWAHLIQARDAIASLSREVPRGQDAWRCLGIAEGSDWLWWFGDTHFSAQAEEFDRLFRIHLSNCYQLAGLQEPEALKVPIRRRTNLSLIEPTGPTRVIVDGRETSYYEWLYAGKLNLKQQYSAIQRGEQCLQRLYYGFDETNQYVRLDIDREALDRHPSWKLELLLSHDLTIHITSNASGAAAQLVQSATQKLVCALGTILELAIPLRLLGLKERERLQLAVSLMQGKEIIERYPAYGSFELLASADDLESQLWSV